MIKKSIAILTLVFVANIGSAQDIMCLKLKDCVAGSAFSAENIHRIRPLGAEPPWDIIDFRWHKSEPILFVLTNWRSADEAGTSGTDLEIWEYVDRGYKSRNHLIRRPFTQLELTLDTVIGGTDSGSLLFWDIKQGELLHEFPVSDGEVSELLLHPSNQWLLVAIDDAKLFQFDLKSKSAAEIQLPGAEEIALHALSFSGDGQLLAGGGQGTIRIWDTRSWEEWKPQRLSAKSIADLQFTEADSHLIVMADASVSRWSLADDRLTFLRELESYPNKRPCHIRDGDISPDGTLLMTTDNCDQTRAWNLQVDREVFISQLDFSDDISSGNAVVFSPDGRFLAVVTDSYWVLLIVPETT